jgi:teichuronic acid exporter
MDMPTLKQTTVHGISWSIVDNITTTGITFIVGIVLARLLTPSEFGILGMITVFIAVSNTIADSGFSNALIREKDTREIDFNTVFYCNIVLSLLLFLILFFSAPVISRFFREPILIGVTRAMASILIINSFGNIHRTLLIKAINFKTQTMISVIASVSSGFTGIIMAYKGFGVWSLVGQQISRQLLNSVFLWVFSNWYPKFAFSKESFRRLFSFGSKLLLSGLIDTLYKNIYYLIIGKFYTASQLGQYTRAEQFNMVFSTNLTSVVQRVSFPVLSSIQDDQDRLKHGYRMVIRTTMMFTFACMLGLAAIAKPLILILIGEKWLPAVYYLQIICFAGMLYPLHAININMLQVKNRSDLVLRLEIIKKAIAVIPIILGIFFGIELMLWGSVLASFVAFFLNSQYSAGLINYSTWSQIKDILPSFFISFGVSAIMWSISFLPFSNWTIIILQLLTGIVLSFTIYRFFDLTEYAELKSMINIVLKRSTK